jgi:triosephosphate isomerase
MSYFGSNLKMNHGPAETRAFVARICENAGGTSDAGAVPVQLWIAPSFINICAAREARTDARVWIGAQNVHWAEPGAFTGEISAWQLAQAGVDFVMLGHVERRTLFGETDERLRLKVNACAHHGLRVMLCVGEGRPSSASNASHEVVIEQLTTALADYERPADLLILYEPAWSVGAGGAPADTEHVAQAFTAIKSALGTRYGAAGQRVPLLYGGSVTAANAAAYAAISNCSGIGVGRAAWKADDFLGVLQRAAIARTDPAGRRETASSLPTDKIVIERTSSGQAYV